MFRSNVKADKDTKLTRALQNIRSSEFVVLLWLVTTYVFFNVSSS